ncbi:MAG: DUF1330 domain-containing protein [Pedosphaera sp.]|nr:DUF1330 domain-containing protein [Pedosphaera sp.]
MASIEPTAEQFQQLVQDIAEPGALVMINLLRYRDCAQYPVGSEATPCTGREAYQRYAAVAVTKVEEVGGKVLWMGSVKTALIAPPDETWDDALLVQYPSRQAFVEMVSRPDYQAGAVHRTAALADSRLLLTVETALPTNVSM